jgi:hypothetical protein
VIPQGYPLWIVWIDQDEIDTCSCYWGVVVGWVFQGSDTPDPVVANDDGLETISTRECAYFMSQAEAEANRLARMTALRRHGQLTGGA